MVPSDGPLVCAGQGEQRSRPQQSYYRRALSLTSLAGVARLPQVSIPLGRTPDSPVGLSLISAYGQDLFLTAAAVEIGRALEASA